MHELRSLDGLFENGLHVGPALAALAVRGPEDAFARELYGEAVRHEVPGLELGDLARHPARKRKDAALAAGAPVKLIRREPRSGERAVDGARPEGGARCEERRVGREEKARERVVPERIEFAQVGEIPGRLLEAAVVKERLEDK